MQTAFPGVGNWMADEILLRARINPRVLCGKLSAKQIEALWKEAREVCQVALETVGVDFLPIHRRTGSITSGGPATVSARATVSRSRPQPSAAAPPAGAGAASGKRSHRAF